MKIVEELRELHLLTKVVSKHGYTPSLNSYYNNNNELNSLLGINGIITTESFLSKVKDFMKSIKKKWKDKLDEKTEKNNISISSKIKDIEKILKSEKIESSVSIDVVDVSDMSSVLTKYKKIIDNTEQFKNKNKDQIQKIVDDLWDEYKNFENVKVKYKKINLNNQSILNFINEFEKSKAKEIKNTSFVDYSNSTVFDKVYSYFEAAGLTDNNNKTVFAYDETLFAFATLMEEKFSDSIYDSLKKIYDNIY